MQVKAKTVSTFPQRRQQILPRHHLPTHPRGYALTLVQQPPAVAVVPRQPIRDLLGDAATVARLDAVAGGAVNLKRIPRTPERPVVGQFGVVGDDDVREDQAIGGAADEADAAANGRHRFDRGEERLTGVQVEAELPVALVLAARQPPARSEIVLVAVEYLAADPAGVHQDHLVFVGAEATHPVDQAQPVDRRGQPLHLDPIPGVERADQDRAAHVGVVRGRAEQPVQHRADTAELQARLVGGVDDQGDG